MRRELSQFLADLKSRDQAYKVPSISELNGGVLRSLVLASGARDVLELGTANGYSTIWIASALEETGGKLITLEHSTVAFAIAKENIERSGVSNQVEQISGDAGVFLDRLPADRFFDAIFIDSEKKSTLPFFQKCYQHLRPGGWMVVDDVRKFRFKMEGFYEYLESEKIAYDLLDTDPDDSMMFLRKPQYS